MNFSVLEAFCAYLYKKRLLLAVNFLVACVAGAVYVFTVLEKEYSASVTFLPPANDNAVSASALSLMNFSMPSLSTGGASPEQVEIVFRSNATKRRIIDEFNLVKYFKLEKSQNTFVLAAKRLKKYAILASSDKGGLGMSKTVSYDITCYYSSPDTAKMMAEFTFGIVDSAVREISIDKAQRNRIFVEKQIVVQNQKMDSLQLVFQEYQNTHRAYDVPEQAKFSLKAYADLKSLALMNEMRLSSLRSEFSGATQEIAELRRHQRVYEAKLKEYESGDDPNVIPSLDRTSKLFPGYAKMLRDIEVQNQLILLLTKELEQARLQEARDVSPLIVVDPAFVPEYKARPRRIPLLFVIVFTENVLFLGLIAYLFYFRQVLAKSDRFNAFVKSVKRG